MLSGRYDVTDVLSGRYDVTGSWKSKSVLTPQEASRSRVNLEAAFLPLCYARDLLDDTIAVASGPVSTLASPSWAELVR